MPKDRYPHRPNPWSTFRGVGYPQGTYLHRRVTAGGKTVPSPHKKYLPAIWSKPASNLSKIEPGQVSTNVYICGLIFDQTSSFWVQLLTPKVWKSVFFLLVLYFWRPGSNYEGPEAPNRNRKNSKCSENHVFQSLKGSTKNSKKPQRGSTEDDWFS